MRRFAIIVASVLVVCTGDVATTSGAHDEFRQLAAQEPPIRGIHWARGQAPARPGGGSPDLTYHGGPVMTQGA